MPFSNKFSGDYVYNIEYDAIDPNDLFDDFAMADLMEELPTINGLMAGSKLGDEELLHCDRKNDVAEKKKNKKRKLYERSNLNKIIADTMNKLAHTFTRGDLKALKEYMDTHIAPDCTLLTPTIEKSVTGREHVYKFHETLILLHPELICEYHNFTAESDDTIYFTFAFDATYFDPENKSQFTNRYSDADPKAADTIDSSLWQNNHVNGQKFEKNEDENHEKYAQLVQTHKPIEVTARGCMRVVYSIADGIVTLHDIKLKWLLKRIEESEIEL